MKTRHFLFLLLALAFVGCDKPVVEEDGGFSEYAGPPANYIYTNSTNNDISIKLYYKSIPSDEPYPEPNSEFVVEAGEEYTLSYGCGLWGSIVEPLSVGEYHPSNTAVISNGIRTIIQYRSRKPIPMRPMPNLYRFDTYTQEYTDGIVYMRYTFKDADFVML